MGSEHLQLLPDAIASADRLPSLPGAAIEILQLAKDPNAGLDDYADSVSKDPALTLRLMKLANSSLFTLGSEITTLERATLVLGMKTVQLMALSFSLIEALPKEDGSGDFSHSQFWKRSLYTAVAGRELGRLVEFALADEAFLAGLLSSLGQLVIAECLPEDYAKVMDAAPDWPTASIESEILGFHHGEIGAALMTEWGMPSRLASTISGLDAAQEDPEADNAVRSLVKVTRLARLVTRILCDEEKGAPLQELYEASDSVGLSKEHIDTLMLALEQRIQEMASLLTIDIGDSVSHYQILEEARRKAIALSVETVAEAPRRGSGVERDYRALVTPGNRDELTGLGDRSFFDTVLAKELRGRVYGDEADALGVLLIEIVQLEDLRGRLGQPAADEILRTIGRGIEGLSRLSDAPARHEEHRFGIVVPSCTEDSLSMFSDRIHAAMKRLEIPVPGGRMQVDVRIGGATLEKPKSLRDGEPLVLAASNALAQAQGPGDTLIVSAD